MCYKLPQTIPFKDIYEFHRTHLLYAVREINAKPLRYGLQVSLAPLLDAILKQTTALRQMLTERELQVQYPEANSYLVGDSHCNQYLKLTLNM